LGEAPKPAKRTKPYVPQAKCLELAEKAVSVYQPLETCIGLNTLGILIPVLAEVSKAIMLHEVAVCWNNIAPKSEDDRKANGFTRHILMRGACYVISQAIDRRSRVWFGESSGAERARRSPNDPKLSDGGGRRSLCAGDRRLGVGCRAVGVVKGSVVGG
jgi:hypothetical protein